MKKHPIYIVVVLHLTISSSQLTYQRHPEPGTCGTCCKFPGEVAEGSRCCLNETLVVSEREKAAVEDRKDKLDRIVRVTKERSWKVSSIFKIVIQHLTNVQLCFIYFRMRC